MGTLSSAEMIKSWTSLKKDTIKVDGSGQMHVLRTRGDGNCIFKSLRIAVKGLVCDESQKKHKQMTVEAFEDNFSTERMRISAILTHAPVDCITKEICK